MVTTEWLDGKLKLCDWFKLVDVTIRTRELLVFDYLISMLLSLFPEIGFVLFQKIC